MICKTKFHPAFSEVILTNNGVDFNFTFFHVSSYHAAGTQEDTIMNKNKHLSLAERVTIKLMLDDSASFKKIGRALGRDCTTISKEVRNHLLFQKTGCFGRPFNDCANRRSCPSPVSAPIRTAISKNAACVPGVIFTVRIISKHPVLLYPSLPMSSMAAPKKRCTLEKHICSSNLDEIIMAPSKWIRSASSAVPIPISSPF